MLYSDTLPSQVEVVVYLSLTLVSLVVLYQVVYMVGVVEMLSLFLIYVDHNLLGYN